MISVTGLSKSFGATHALRDVTFRLGAGEVVGLLGRNGAGKTTTMRILTGYFPPSAGTVSVAGHDLMAEPSAAKARVGYLPENPPVYGEMSVASYLRFCAQLRGLRGAVIAARVDEVVSRCGLSEVRGRVIGHLSRGYRQRVGLAQALVHDPDVLILDEPTAALDPGQIHEIRNLIRELSAEEREGSSIEGAAGATRRTVLLSTHRLEDVVATCHRALIISRGKLVADEPVATSTQAAELEKRFLSLTAGEESR